MRRRPHAATPTKGAFHLLPDALNGAAADAALAGNRQHAFAGAQLSLDALFKRGIDPRPTELLALRYGALKASVDPLPDHAALKLRRAIYGSARDGYRRTSVVAAFWLFFAASMPTPAIRHAKVMKPIAIR